MNVPALFFHQLSQSTLTAKPYRAGEEEKEEGWDNQKITNIKCLLQITKMALWCVVIGPVNHRLPF